MHSLSRPSVPHSHLDNQGQRKAFSSLSDIWYPSRTDILSLQSHGATEYCDTCQPVAPRRLGVVMLRHVFATRARARAHVLYSSSPDVHFHIPSFTPTFPHSLPHSFIYSTVSLIVSIVLHTRLRMSQELRTPDHDTI